MVWRMATCVVVAALVLCGGGTFVCCVRRGGLPAMLVALFATVIIPSFGLMSGVAGVSLRDRFSRLFDLSMLKGELVFAMCTLGWGVDGRAWQWRHRLFAWAEELVREHRLLLENVNLQVTREERWLWRLDSSSIYTVRSAYNFLNEQVPHDSAVQLPPFWHKDL